MHSTVFLETGQQTGKRAKSRLIAPNRDECMNIFSVRPVNSSFEFLIDTGSVVSLVPQCFGFSSSLNSEPFYAANGSTIKTFGKIKQQIQINNKIYPWTFVIADIRRAIIGADFLTHYNLLVDCKNAKLIDKIHNENITLEIKQSKNIGIIAPNNNTNKNKNNTNNPQPPNKYKDAKNPELKPTEKVNVPKWVEEYLTKYKDISKKNKKPKQNT